MYVFFVEHNQAEGFEKSTIWTSSVLDYVMM